MSTPIFSVEPPRVLVGVGAVVDLAPLQEMGDPALTAEIAQLFIDTTIPLIAELRDAMARADAPELARVAHSVKGASANMYAAQLTAASAALEAAAKRGELASMLTLIEAVDREFEAARTYLRRELALA